MTHILTTRDVHEVSVHGPKSPRDLLKVTEADVTRQIKDYLASQGWFGIRLQSGTVRGVTGGTFMKLNKNGTPDWIFLRGTSYIFVEMKRPGKTLSPDQVKWFAWAKASGVPCLWADSLGSFLVKWAERA